MSDHSDSASSFESSENGPVYLPVFNNHVNHSHDSSGAGNSSVAGNSSAAGNSSLGEFAYLYSPSSQGTFDESSHETGTPVLPFKIDDEEEPSKKTENSKASKNTDTLSTLSTYRASIASNEPLSPAPQSGVQLDEDVPEAGDVQTVSEAGDVKTVSEAEVPAQDIVPQNVAPQNVAPRNIADQIVGFQNLANARENMNQIFQGYRRYFIGCAAVIGIVLAIIIILVLCRKLNAKQHSGVVLDELIPGAGRLNIGYGHPFIGFMTFVLAIVILMML